MPSQKEKTSITLKPIKPELFLKNAAGLFKTDKLLKKSVNQSGKLTTHRPKLCSEEEATAGQLIMSLVIGHWFKIQMTSEE